jgi:hypothetical protein
VATLDHAALEHLWISNGGNPIHADVAAAIAQAESGGCQYAKAGPTDDRPKQQCTYRHTTSENSYGLWQINRQAHPTYSAASLYTLNGNAHAAIAISSNGSNFAPWTTFAIGAYVQYLSGAPGGPQPGTTETNPPPGAVEPSVFSGYRDLRNSLAKHLPTQLERSRRTGLVTHRLLTHGRKVRH